ncbi:hypothetical protein Tco_0493678 [Tanacetum coccineum]
MTYGGIHKILKIWIDGVRGVEGEELGLDGMEDDDDEVPLVEGVLSGAFGGVRELGLLVGGSVLTSTS